MCFALIKNEGWVTEIDSAKENGCSTYLMCNVFNSIGFFMNYKIGLIFAIVHVSGQVLAY